MFFVSFRLFLCLFFRFALILRFFSILCFCGLIFGVFCRCLFAFFLFHLLFLLDFLFRWKLYPNKLFSIIILTYLQVKYRLHHFLHAFLILLNIGNLHTHEYQICSIWSCFNMIILLVYLNWIDICNSCGKWRYRYGGDVFVSFDDGLFGDQSKSKELLSVLRWRDGLFQ